MSLLFKAPVRYGSIVVVIFLTTLKPALSGTMEGLLIGAINHVCSQPDASLEETAKALPGLVATAESPIIARATEIGWRRSFDAPPMNGEIILERIAPRKQVRRISAQFNSVSRDDIRPVLLVIAGPDCQVQAARRIRYRDGSAEAVELLDAALEATGSSEPLNPPMAAGDQRDGVLVAMVDAGVNYLLPQIAARLGRDRQGHPLGYDYWDLDDRPFDAHPVRSMFFPQRHGTRTASILLREAPVVTLVPYRYPRPDMSRMADLVTAAANAGVSIVNLSLGGNRSEDWDAFAVAAKVHPEILFIASAGNNGRDIDQKPVYPAVLQLDNLITVTSSDEQGQPARGSNWGSESVDLLVEAEEVLAIGFDGQARIVAGSSYAAARVSALAACLQSQHPQWRAPELKTAIFARATEVGKGFVTQGFIPEPLVAGQGDCPSEAGQIEAVDDLLWDAQAIDAEDQLPANMTHRLMLTLVMLEDSGWELRDLREAARTTSRILRQCAIGVHEARVRVLRTPERFAYFRESFSRAFATAAPQHKPTIYFLRDTLQTDAYDAEAIGRSNSAGRVELQDTVWVTRAIPDPGIGVAHELAHVLADSGEHVRARDNLMQVRTAPGNVHLTDEQCERIRVTGEGNGLLERMP